MFITLFFIIDFKTDNKKKFNLDIEIHIMLYNWPNRWKPKLHMSKKYYQDKDSSIGCESFHFCLFLLFFSIRSFIGKMRMDPKPSPNLNFQCLLWWDRWEWVWSRHTLISTYCINTYCDQFGRIYKKFESKISYFWHFYRYTYVHIINLKIQRKTGNIAYVQVLRRFYTLLETFFFLMKCPGWPRTAI